MCLLYVEDGCSSYINTNFLIKPVPVPKYLVIAVYIFRLISDFTNIIMLIESHYSTNEISKYFIKNTIRTKKFFYCKC